MRTMMEALTRSPSSAEARLAMRRMMTSGFARRRRIWTRPAVRGARAGSFGPISPSLRRAASAVKPAREVWSSARSASTEPCGAVTANGAAALLVTPMSSRAPPAYRRRVWRYYSLCLRSGVTSHARGHWFESTIVHQKRQEATRGGVSRPVCSSVRWRSPCRGERGDGGPRIWLLASQARDDSDQDVQVDWLLDVVLKACAQRACLVLRPGEPREGDGGGRASLLR